MRATGDYGVVKVGYHRAAGFVRWSLTSIPEEMIGQRSPEYSLIGVVASIDTYWSTSRPFTIGLVMGDGRWWVWEVAEIEEGSLQKGTLEAALRGNPVTRSVF